MNLKKIIKQKNKKEIKDTIKNKPIFEIVNKLEELNINDVFYFLSFLKPEFQSKIFIELELEKQEKLIKLFSFNKLKLIINNLHSDEIAHIANQLSKENYEILFKLIDKKTKIKINKLLNYYKDQIGFIMKVDIPLLKKNQTIKEVKKILKIDRKKIKLEHNLYVVNAKKKLLGYIKIEDLLFEDENSKIELFLKPTIFITTTTDREIAAKEFAKSDMSSLPIINSSKELVGMITSDDIIDVVIEEASEDFQKMAGIDSNGNLSYSKSKTINLFKSRSLWLMLLMISATLSQIVLDAFQGFSYKLLEVTLTSAIIAILPVISGASGNAGSQTSSTIIRALAIGDIKKKDYFLVIWKEFKVSILIGLSLGIINFIRLILYYWIKNDLDTQYLFLSLAASISLFVVIILSKFFGGILPLFAKMLKIDPTAMAAPLLTTIIDALSTMIFFSISFGIMLLII